MTRKLSSPLFSPLFSPLLLLSLLATVMAAPVLAQDMADAPMVRRQINWREGRSELKPSLGWTINDRYFHNLILGVGYNYHFLDWVAAGASVGWAFPIKTALADDVEEKKKVPPMSFPIPASHLGLLADAHVELCPGSGKFMLWGKSAFAYDFHAILGIGVLQARWNSEASARLKDEEPSAGMKLSPKAGLGFRLFLDKGVAVTVDVVDHMAYMYTAAEVSADGKSYSFPKEDPSLVHNVTAVFSFSIMMPYETTYEE